MNEFAAMAWACVVLVGGMFLYFAPTMVASQRKHRNTGAIFCLNLLLGWSGIGWIIALVWSFTSDGAR